MNLPPNTNPSTITDIDIHDSGKAWLWRVVLVAIAVVLIVLLVTMVSIVRMWIVNPSLAGMVAGFGVMGVALLIGWVRWRVARAAIRILIDQTDTTELEPLVRRIFAHRARRHIWMTYHEMASSLARVGRFGVIIRLGRKKDAAPIQPIPFEFEAQPLDESDPGFAGLADEVNRSSSDGSGDRNTGKTDRILPVSPRWLERKTSLLGGKTFIVLLLFSMILQLLAFAFFYFAGSAQWIWLLVLAAPIIGLLGTSGAWSWRKQWFVLPGALLLRTGGWRDATWRLHLFDRRTSVLVILGYARRRSLLFVADADRTERTVVTRNEANLLLRGWLSPLEPPPVERLSDLS